MKMTAADKESMWGIDTYYTVVDEDGNEYGTYPSEIQAESKIEKLYEYLGKDVLLGIEMEQ